ncbi:bb3-type cytochrome oxidase subunit III [Glaciimonas immobilis]|uniref:Cytochrome c oxidase subunit 3 n=1 Tax=Glaciimonas immobilis TaxID=728004 RepID=A0A840RL48_9BURK|nr:bb3-type cytochrome oxidase subunit III [Glaciimonas immobilis]KAF3998955.1 bb3-type cytochrome oxidase subunit III [Glaciimonas immobilis]MBB5198365.1 cytochrome c oxidase subunit 3 [Glaciimonas immobilis]
MSAISNFEFQNSRPRSGRNNNAPWPRTATNPAPISIALWIFMGVATALFTLFLAAYAMRMDATDWSPIAMPWQLWLSTISLIAASLMLHVASKANRSALARNYLIVAGTLGVLFLGAQSWGWYTLQTLHVTAAGNPAGSFFYLLTAIHGLHVVGGLVGWVRTERFARFGQRGGGSVHDLQWRVRLCARYWDFLLAVWIVLFAALGWLTPDIVRFVCGNSLTS